MFADSEHLCCGEKEERKVQKRPGPRGEEAFGLAKISLRGVSGFLATMKHGQVTGCFLLKTKQKTSHVLEASFSSRRAKASLVAGGFYIMNTLSPYSSDCRVCGGPSVLRLYIVWFCLVFESCEDLDWKRSGDQILSGVRMHTRCSLLQQALVFPPYLSHQELLEIKKQMS